MALLSEAELKLALVRLAWLRFAFVSVADDKVAVVRLVWLRSALLSVEDEKTALVRFCPAKFQPVRLFEDKLIRVKSSAW